MDRDGSFVAVSVVRSSAGVTFRLDTMITCPLNESHIILRANLQSHLERCLTGDLIEMKCPWNPQHVVDETSYENHKHQCLDKPEEILPIQPSDVKLEPSTIQVEKLC